MTDKAQGNIASNTVPVFLVMFLPWVYIGTRYRIVWDGNEIIQKAFGLSDVSIRLDEISLIRSETSDAKEFAKMNRPFRRISIYAGSRKDEKFVDISIKHFEREDIQKLFKIIYERRPDLDIPKSVQIHVKENIH